MAVLTRALVAALLLTLGACSAAAEPKIAAKAAWIRVPPPGAPTAGGFVTLANTGGPDALVGAASPIAGMVMVHRSFEEEGMAKMEHVSSLPIPQNGTVSLSPGGYHLMFMQMKGPLIAGDRVPVTLKFKRGGARTVDFIVAASAPGG